MVNKNKIKGSKWERDFVKQVSAYAKSCRRIPGSGAIGTLMHESRLTGDVDLRYEFLQKPLKVELKYGYGGSSQMIIKREWMEKIRQQAKLNNSIPAVAIKFRDVTGGDIESAKWICFSVEDWNDFVKYLNDLFSDLDEFWRNKYDKAEEKVGTS